MNIQELYMEVKVEWDKKEEERKAHNHKQHKNKWSEVWSNVIVTLTYKRKSTQVNYVQSYNVLCVTTLMS